MALLQESGSACIMAAKWTR